MKRSRILYFHEETNEGKIQALEALSAEYRRYLQTCLDTMISQKRLKVPNEEILKFFPKENILNTNLVAACQRHAVEILSGWAASLYTRKIKARIKWLFREGSITETQRFQLFTIGKYSVDLPTENLPQEALDLYWSFLLDPEVSGRPPQVSNRIGMRMSIHTSTVKLIERTIASWWLGLSTLIKRATIKVPLKANPHLKSPDEIVHGCLVRKDKRGRWRVEFLEKKALEEPKLDMTLPRIGVDVGLNVIAATSDGRLLGEKIKPKFDKLYSKVRDLRANRQRQEFKENSCRLDRLEDKLTGMIKTCAGEAANKLVEAYPSTVFVIEDLDLSGCRGQKRFAYRALHHSLERKAPTLAVNPAYSSQPCPSCGYVSRNNRKGIKFRCRSCGRISHADVVGGKNLVRRSYDKEVRLDDDPSEVRAILRERYCARRRDSSSGEFAGTAFVAPNRRLTTRGSSQEDTGTASNAEVNLRATAN